MKQNMDNEKTQICRVFTKLFSHINSIFRKNAHFEKVTF